MNYFLEPKRHLARLTERMNFGLKALLVVVAIAILATSALACPLWLGSQSQDCMPCPDQSDTGHQCPDSICQLSAPYLSSPSHASDHAPLLQELPSATIAAIHLRTPFLNDRPLRQEYGPLPGTSVQLFLQTHSLRV
jgi:hypothetical protein